MRINIVHTLCVYEERPNVCYPPQFRHLNVRSLHLCTETKTVWVQCQHISFLWLYQLVLLYPVANLSKKLDELAFWNPWELLDGRFSACVELKFETWFAVESWPFGVWETFSGFELFVGIRISWLPPSWEALPIPRDVEVGCCLKIIFGILWLTSVLVARTLL